VLGWKVCLRKKIPEGDKILAKLFIRYKTAVPSSAAVERFFSQGKDILKAKRASLSPFIRFIIYKM
jgi:hypothetical protein